MKPAVKPLLSICFLFLLPLNSRAWGFFAHQRINRLAVFSLPPEMMALYKPRLAFITGHATDPDKLRYVLPEEGFHHYIDMDRYGLYPYAALPHNWDSAVAKFGRDTLLHNGIVPWEAEKVFYRLTAAFREKNTYRILKLSAYLGHYMADACVPLHANSNYNGQQTGQEGIHSLWETRIPELLADSTFNYWTGKAEYIARPSAYIWRLVEQSGREADTVLKVERSLSRTFPADLRYTFLERKGQLLRTYSPVFVTRYNDLLGHMVERRMRAAIHAVASLWYTAWVNAGQPDLQDLTHQKFSPAELEEFKILNEKWHNATPSARIHE